MTTVVTHVSPVTPSPADIQDLRVRLRGVLLEPGTDAYEESRRLQNGLIDRRPAVIARCSGTADVVQAVTWAGERGVLLSVRAGGHNVAGNAMNDGGLVIDLTAMRGVHVDPRARRVRVGGGATWGDVDRETQLFGLAVPGGVVSTTGVAGLTLHGGYGHLRRSHGLSIDNLISAEVVTADGQVRTASAIEHPDLFWAVRGAGSNFGVVTSFEFAAHAIGPEVFLCAPFYALEDARQVLTAWRDFTTRASEAVNALAIAWSIPDVEAFPPELRNRGIVATPAVFAGPAAEGARVLQPLRELATPLIDLSGPAPWTAVQTGFDAFFPKGRLYYWKSTYIHDLSHACLEQIVAAASKRPSPLSDVVIWHLGGAMARPADGDMAYARRDAPYLVTGEASWTDPGQNEANIRWTRDLLAAIRPYSRGGLYLNFPGFGEEKEGMLRDAYGPNYDRLAALKATYDPRNVFRVNLNIAPAA